MNRTLENIIVGAIMGVGILGSNYYAWKTQKTSEDTFQVLGYCAITTAAAAYCQSRLKRSTK